MSIPGGFPPKTAPGSRSPGARDSTAQPIEHNRRSRPMLSSSRQSSPNHGPAFDAGPRARKPLGAVAHRRPDARASRPRCRAPGRGRRVRLPQGRAGRALDRRSSRGWSRWRACPLRASSRLSPACPAGAWFGEGSLLKNEPRKYDVVALRESRVALMPRATFIRAARRQHRVQPLPARATERAPRPVHRPGRIRSPAQRRGARRALPRGDVQSAPLPGHRPQLPISQEEIGYLVRPVAPARQPGAEALEQAGLLRIDYGGISCRPARLRNFGSTA